MSVTADTTRTVTFEVACRRALLGKIVFQGHFDGGRSDVYAINPDGTGLEQLTEHPADEVSPVVSPDGSRIAFMYDRW